MKNFFKKIDFWVWRGDNRFRLCPGRGRPFPRQASEPAGSTAPHHAVARCEPVTVGSHIYRLV